MIFGFLADAERESKMQLFQDCSTRPVDPDSRTRIPEKFADNLGNPFVMTRGFGCIYLMHINDYEAAAARVGETSDPILDMVDPNRAILRHFLFSGAVVTSRDKQYRVTLTPELRKHAGIEKDSVVFVGGGKWVEVWDPERWEQRKSILSAEKVHEACLAIFSGGAAGGQALSSAGPAERND